MKTIKSLIFVLLSISIISIVSCSKESSDQKQNNSDTGAVIKSNAKVFPVVSSEKPIGKMAGDFVWEENGKQVKFSEFTKGKFVLLNFWGTWCPPCRRELPDIISISKEMESKGLIVIGVAMERGSEINEVIREVSNFYDNQQMNYPVVIGNSDLAIAYGGIESVPSTFLINDKGEIVKVLVGMKTKTEFMDEINSVMKK